MNRHTTTVMLSLLGIFSYAQAVTCKKGIQCGNTCISASYTCHVGGPIVPAVTTPTVQTLTSPPLPAEPSGTYFGWSVIDNSPALLILSNRATPVPISIGYTKQLLGLTPQTARARVERVLTDELPSTVVVSGRQVGTSYQWLARRGDGSRGVLILLDLQATGVSLQISAFSASSTFDLPGFTGTTRDALLTQVAPVTAPQTIQAPVQPTAPASGELSLTISPDNMFTDPTSGNLVVAAQCQPFSFSIKPSQAFSKITLTEKLNERLAYSLDVTVDGKLRFTQSSHYGYGGTTLILVGQQQAGSVVNFTSTPEPYSPCKGVINIGIKVE